MQEKTDQLTPSETTSEPKLPSFQAMGPFTASLLLAYEVAWLVTIGVLLFIHRYYIYHLYTWGGTWEVPLWIGEGATLGMLGGVAYAVHAICSRKTGKWSTTDRTLWYLVKPVNGALVGAVCGLMAKLVLSVSGSAGIEQHILIGAVGFVAGMYEDFALAFIRSFADKKLNGHL